jgi:hypothetical protein
MHAWYQPPEALLAMASTRDLPLLMPRLGEAVEPSRGPLVTPWWRAVDGARATNVATPTADETFPKAMPWPFD